MPREIPSYLRLVKSGEASPLVPEVKPPFEWQQIPTSLAEIEIIAKELYTQSGRIDGAVQSEFTEALENIEGALREDLVALEIEERSITKTTRALITSFEALWQAEQNVNVELFPELPGLIEHTTEMIFERLVEVATKGGSSELGAPNPAFRYVLQIYGKEPLYQPLIEDQVEQPIKKMLHKADWATRAEEQEEIEKIGHKLRNTHSTLELLRRLSTVVAPERTIYLNPSLKVRRPVKGATLTQSILFEIRNMGADALENFGVLRQNGYEPADIATLNLPQLGDYSTLATVLPEIQKEKLSWQQASEANRGEVLLEQCNSWFMLVWYVNQAIHGTDRFSFNVKDPDTGLKLTKILTGNQVIECVERAPINPEYVYHLPSGQTTTDTNQKGRFLVELRTRLQAALD